MELIQATFQEAKEIAIQESSIEKIDELLKIFSNEFISVAYEGASMAIALKSIQETNSLKNWNEFYHDYALKHSSQVHVGLGWAFSELNLNFSSFDLNIAPSLKYRVMDGYGYYEGLFKRRQSVRMQQYPQNFSQIALKAYDQGLGRSLWYISQGEVEKLIKLINIFPENRHYDIWRGVGIAVAYVGGIGIPLLQQLINESAKYLSSFKCGISLLVQSRCKAGTISEDTKLICEFIFKLSCNNVNDQLILIEKETISSPELMYFDWLKNIEERLCS